MNKYFIVLTICAILLCTHSIFGSDCNIDALKIKVNEYLKSQENGSIDKYVGDARIQYVENMNNKSIIESVLNKNMSISFSRSVYDEQECKSFTEIIVNDKENPYVIGMRIGIDGDNKINYMESMVSTEGDWEFDADGYYSTSSKEQWSRSRNEHLSRDELINISDMYFDMFEGNKTKAPFTASCSHLEGGKKSYTSSSETSGCFKRDYTGKVLIVNRSYVVDVQKGIVNVFSRFGKTDETSVFGKTEGLPDSHTFKIEGGKIKYIHSITIIR